MKNTITNHTNINGVLTPNGIAANGFDQKEKNTMKKLAKNMKNMKKTIITFGLITGFILAVNLSATAQTRISFAKGASEKTISVTLAAGASKSFVLAVSKKQAINANALIKSNDLILFSFGLENANDSIDNWEDYEGGLTVLTGRKGDYIFSVTNNTKKSRTFKMKVRVGPASEYDGGISNE